MQQSKCHAAGKYECGCKWQRMPAINLSLCGDVMTGRGIDQVLPYPSEPSLHESYVDSAAEYVELAARANGPILNPVSFSYIWGDAAGELERVKPDVRIVNLETSITTSEDYESKGINYRMHPANTPCLAAAKIDCCVLANNHVLDWGYAGLNETLATLHKAGIRTAGAGQNVVEAEQPAVIQLGGARVLVLAAGMTDSGIPPDWAATDKKPGILEPQYELVAAVSDGKSLVDAALRLRPDLIIVDVSSGLPRIRRVEPDCFLRLMPTSRQATCAP